MFPSILKGLRKRKGVTQIQLAEAIGGSVGNIGDWESGKSLPSYQALIKLPTYFDISADILLGIRKIDELPELPERLTEKEAELIAAVRTLDQRDREDLFDLAEIKLRRKTS